jgi:S-adenosylmethionine-dependent methyltransferase
LPTDYVPFLEVKVNTGVKNDNRFDGDAERYAAYLETPEGRLRTELAFATVAEFLPVPLQGESLCALDLGGGTGATAIRLARLGIDVTMIDSSAAMIEVAKRKIAEAGLTNKIEIERGDVLRLPQSLHTSSFDVVLCHNVLEFLDDPSAAVQAAATFMRNSWSILSVLVRNQAGEVLKAALLQGDLVTAEHNLDNEWAQESLYGEKVRLFNSETLQQTLSSAMLDPITERGVRVIADYLPEKISRAAEYDRIFALERKLGTRQEYVGVARYIHMIARRVVGGGKVNE